MTHLAEDPAELEFLRTGGGPWKKILQILGLWDGRFKPPGTSPVGWAKSIGLLDRPSLLAHVNFADDQDIRTLSQGRASVVYCPLAHRYFRHPPHRYRDMLDAGVNVILGTDSLACAPTLSMFRQMQALHEAGGLGPERILAMATGNTSKSLRLEHLIGTIEKDKIADLIILAIDRRYGRRPVLGLVEPGGTVLAVLIDGNLVYV